MKIDFHSEKFKKTMVWIIALVILPAFLLGGGVLTGLFHGGGGNVDKVKVTVFGEEVDPEEYQNFAYRWGVMFSLYKKIDTIYSQEDLKAIAAKINQAQQGGFKSAPVFTGKFVLDCYLPGGMIEEVRSWIPEEQGENLNALMQGDSNAFTNEVVANLFARTCHAKKLGLMPTDDEVVNGKIYHWFRVADYEKQEYFLDEEGYKKFLSGLYGNIPLETAKRYFRETVGEFIAMDRLERFENPQRDTKLDELGDDVLQLIDDKEQRKFDYFVIAPDQYKPAAEIAYEKAAAAPDAAKLEELYKTLVKPDDEEKGYIYQQPRSFSGSILLIDMAKVDEIVRPDVEKKIEEQTEGDAQKYEEDAQKYYDAHKEDYLIKPEKPAPEGEDTEEQPAEPDKKPGDESESAAPADETPVSEAGDTEAPAATEKAEEKSDEVAPKEPKVPEAPKPPQYKPFAEVKDEIIAKLKNDRIEEAMITACDKHLDELYEELDDYVNAQRRIDVAAAAKAFKDGSLGSMLNGLAEFGKALARAAANTEKLPDLKPFADKHDEVSLTKTETYLNTETALKADKIGGKPFSRLLGENYYELKYYPFDSVRPCSALYMLTPITDGAKENDEDPKYKFVFRIEDVREPELLPFADLKKSAPDTYEKLLEDYAEKRIAENAFDEIVKQETLITGQIESKDFDFDKRAKETAAAIKAYDEWKKNKDKKDDEEATDSSDSADDDEEATDSSDSADDDEADDDEADDEEAEEEPGFKTTDYIDITGYFPGAHTQETLMQTGFELSGDKVATVRIKVNKDDEYESVIVVRLHKDKDGIVKPIRRMSFKQFAEMMADRWSPHSNMARELTRKRFEYFSSAITIVIPEVEEEEIPEDERDAETEG